MDNNDLLMVLESDQQLRHKIDEAMRVLSSSRAKDEGDDDPERDASTMNSGRDEDASHSVESTAPPHEPSPAGPSKPSASTVTTDEPAHHGSVHGALRSCDACSDAEDEHCAPPPVLEFATRMRECCQARRMGYTAIRLKVAGFDCLELHAAGFRKGAASRDCLRSPSRRNDSVLWVML